jgi:magnesium chelatase subunit I
VELIAQEANLVASVPEHLIEVVARFTRGLRESAAVDQRSGVSARFAIAGAESVAASALRRSARTGETAAVARVCDVPTVVPTLLGKVEFEMGEEGREREVLDHLLRVAVAEAFRDRLVGLDLSGFTDLFAEGAVVETGELVPAADLLAQIGTVPGLSKVLDRLGHGDDASPGEVAAAVEFVLEGLHLTRRIDKDTVAGRTVYGA